MPKFEVEIYELHICTYGVDAETPNDAVRKVLNGDGWGKESIYVSTATKYSDFKMDGKSIHGVRSVKKSRST